MARAGSRKKVTKKKTTKAAAGRTASRKAPAAKAGTAKKPRATARAGSAKKSVVKKTTAKKAAPKKATPKKAAAGKTAVKATPKKTAARASAKKTTARRPATGKKAAASKAAARPQRVRTTRGTSKETPVKKAKRVDLRKIKKELLERRALLLGNLTRHTATGSDAGEKPVGDRADDASFDLELDSSYTLAEHEAQEVRLIDIALEKIANGTYGSCEECGGPIEAPRLEALPYAVLCLQCKQNEELNQRPEASDIVYGRIEEE